MASGFHFRKVCKHGIVMGQCRCIGPKVDQLVECSCVGPEVAPADMELLGAGVARGALTAAQVAEFVAYFDAT